MCVDANAGARFAAKQRHLDKTFKFKSQSIQYWNRETELKRDKKNAITFEQFSKLEIPEKLISNGIVLVWSHKKVLSDLVQHMR